jgi:predicted PurR-regulated permease PerM
MKALSALFLVLGVAEITFGMLLWLYIPQIMSKNEQFLDEYTRSQAQQFLASHANDLPPPTNWMIPKDLQILQFIERNIQHSTFNTERPIPEAPSDQLEVGG